MATIRTAIQIQDRLSQPMRAMHNAVSTMVNQMETLHAASGDMMDTSSIEIARRELARAADAFNQIDNEIREADNAQQRFNNHIRDGTNAAGGLLGKVLALVAAYLSLRSIGDVVQLSDAMTNIDARLNLVVDSMPEVEDVTANLKLEGTEKIQSQLQNIDIVAQAQYNDENLKMELAALSDTLIDVGVNTDLSTIEAAKSKLSEIENNAANLNISVANMQAVDELKSSIKNIEKDINLNVKADGMNQVAQIQQQILEGDRKIRTQLQNIDIVAEAQYNDENLKMELAALSDTLIDVGVNTDLSAIEATKSKLSEIENNAANLNISVANMQAVDELKSSIKNIEKDINLNVKADGMAQVAQLQQQIFDAAQRSFASYAQTADLVGKIGMNAKDAFNNTSEVVAFAELLNKQFGIAGTNAEGVSSATLQLTQALGSGVLRGEELNSVFEAAPNIIHTIAEYLDEPIGRIRKMAAEGQLTSDVVKKAMFASADSINDKFNSMPVTFEQIWTEFQNNALWAFKGVLQQINGIFNSDRFAAFRESAGQSMQTIATLASYALKMMASVGAFIYDNWSFIAPVVGGVTAALIINAAAWAWTNRAIAINALMTSTAAIRNLWYVATTVLSTWATYGFTAAMAALSIAIAANPIGWLIGAIVVLITLFYLAVAAINHFTGTSISATGIVAGAFMVLATFIYNRIAYLWNIFASIAEFFVNVWQHPMYSVKKLFYNLASNVLDKTIAMSKGWDNFATGFANAMIDAVNMAIKAWNWLIDLLPEDISAKIGLGKGTEFNHRTSITSDLEGIKGSLGDWVGEAPENYWEAPKMEMKSLGGAWDKGYNWGADLFSSDAKDKNESKEDPWKDIMAGLGDGVAAAEKAAESGKDTSGNTAKMAKSMEGAGEDLKYMRDLADRESINRYTTAEIKVDMKNENYINSDMDIDGVIDQFGEKIEEAAANIAEGD